MKKTKMKQNLPNDNKILAAIATVAALAFFGLWSINSSECGGVLHIKRTGSSLEVILDKRNCKVPTIADTPGKPLALDHTNDSTEEQPLID